MLVVFQNFEVIKNCKVRNSEQKKHVDLVLLKQKNDKGEAGKWCKKGSFSGQNRSMKVGLFGGQNRAKKGSKILKSETSDKHKGQKICQNRAKNEQK